MMRNFFLADFMFFCVFCFQQFDCDLFAFVLLILSLLDL